MVDKLGQDDDEDEGTKGAERGYGWRLETGYNVELLVYALLISTFGTTVLVYNRSNKVSRG